MIIPWFYVSGWNNALMDRQVEGQTKEGWTDRPSKQVFLHNWGSGDEFSCTIGQGQNEFLFNEFYIFYK